MKPIRLTEELIHQAVEEFRRMLTVSKMADGKVNYQKNFTYASAEDQKATIIFSPEAYTKMVMLLMAFDSEVAWHGVCARISDTEFLISDILVYPQKVTSATVDMDPVAYTKWLIDNDDDERFEHIRMQGHSHVNMATSPSVTDVTHQEEILDQLKGDSYYIFMIWNKKLAHTTKIYDLANNVMYEDDDIVYTVIGDDIDYDAFIEDAKSKVTKAASATSGKSASSYGGYGSSYYSGYGSSYYSGGYNSGYNGECGSKSSSSSSSEKEKSKKKTKSRVR